MEENEERLRRELLDEMEKVKKEVNDFKMDLKMRKRYT